MFGGGAFEQRVRERLRQVRCQVPDELSVRVRVRPRTTNDESPYAISFRRPAGGKPAAAPPVGERGGAGVPTVRITVIEGRASRRVHELRFQRINLGRLASVEGRGAVKLRRNHVAFVDADDPVNATVSRAHAHIEYFAGDGHRVFDDGSAHGTRIARDGRSIPVARGAVRGVRLRPGDEIELGLAKVAFEVE